MTAAVRDLQGFAEALDHLAHNSPNPLARMAERIGRKPNYLRKACSRHDDAHPFRGDLIVPMTLASADHPDRCNYVLVEYVARGVGGIFVRVPANTGRFGVTPNVLREVGEYLQALASGSADARYTRAEAVRIRREGMEVVAAILADLEHVDRVSDVAAVMRLAMEPGR